MNLLCMQCGEAFVVEADDPTNACPHCGDVTTETADLDRMIDINISEHELRILTYWAESYARLCGGMGWDPERKMPKVLETIRDRLAMQTSIALSMAQSIADMRQNHSEDHGHAMEFVLVDPFGNCIECHKFIATYTDLLEHQCGLGDVDEYSTETDQDDVPPAP